MAAGVLALGAAVLATQIAAGQLKSQRAQLQEQRDQHTRERARQLAAARLRLPLALSAVIGFSNQVLIILKAHLDAILAGDPLPAPGGAPLLPEEAIQALSAFVEATDDSAAAALVSDMVGAMQVLNSRMRAFQAEARGLNIENTHSYILNAARVRAYAEIFFGYARREVDDPPHTLAWDRVSAALFFNDMLQGHYPDLHAFVGRARARAEGQANLDEE